MSTGAADIVPRLSAQALYLAVVPTSDNYTRQHPTSALHMVKVADSSLVKARNIKTRVYVAAGIPE